jgi:hypothetical protein
MAATGGEWKCECGWRNRNENSVCGGIRRSDAPTLKQYGCGAPRRNHMMPPVYGPYDGPENSYSVDGTFGYPRPVGSLAPTLNPVTGEEWKCSCGWKNRPQNVKCGGGRAGFGCGLDRAVEANAHSQSKSFAPAPAVPGYPGYPPAYPDSAQAVAGYSQPYSDPGQAAYPPVYPDTTRGGPGRYPFVPGGYDPMNQHLYPPFWPMPAAVPQIPPQMAQQEIASGSTDKRVIRSREDGSEWRCVCGWRNRADNSLCGGAKRADLTPGLKTYGCGAPRPVAAAIVREGGTAVDEAGHTLIGPTLKRAKPS